MPENNDFDFDRMPPGRRKELILKGLLHENEHEGEEHDANRICRELHRMREEEQAAAAKRESQQPVF